LFEAVSQSKYIDLIEIENLRLLSKREEFSFGLLIISDFAINNLTRISKDESTKEYVVDKLGKNVVSIYATDHV